MTPADLSRTVLHAVRRAVDEDALRAAVPAHVRVERTRPGGSGDYACAVALQLARPAGLPAKEVAALLRDRILGAPGIRGVEITGPGFLNFTLHASVGADARAARVHEIRERGLRYGRTDAGADTLHRLHHPGEIRAAVVAQGVARLLRTQGGQATVGCEADPGARWEELGVPAGLRPGDGGGTETRPVPARATEIPTTPARAVEIRPVPARATASALLARLGRDAALWGLQRPATHDPAPLGDDLIVQGEANPLFLVRYAHARARAIVREGERLGITPVYEEDVEAPALHRALADHPPVLAAAAHHHAPDRVARHLETVADAFFDFHDATPPLPAGDEKPSAAHRSRLALAEAAGTVLAGGLSLLGISAPEHL
ncbi:ArgS-related anticodon-binding protein NrtL [Streptomyces sp. NPDC059166]|uniref:ArgS-related anticodon-binding protein NrtL n=1 Tax=Streptomyces sp. NPDC059166 TaxID=3346752 RepID=UPI003686C68E